MSFDIFFQPCRFGCTPADDNSLLAGKDAIASANEPLNAMELKAVQEVLDKATIHGPDDFGCHVVRAEDGGEAEVFGNNLDHGCMAALRGITHGLLQFLIDLLKAGNWSMVPAMEDTVAIVATKESVKDVPDDFPPIVVCNSPDELGILLSEGFAAWRKYRDQVVGDKP